MNDMHGYARRRGSPAVAWTDLLYRSIDEVLLRLSLAPGGVAGRVLAVLIVSAVVVPLIPGQATGAGQSLTEGGSLRQRIRLIEEPPLAPEVAFLDETGRYWGFAEFQGQVVIAMFWATWCPICAREMPKLDRLQAELGGEGLQVLALSQDSGGAQIVQNYYARRGINHLGVYIDQEAILASVLGIRGVPTVFVIDPAGRIVGVLEGAADWDSPDAVAFLRRLLEQR
jgi:thiol-disulfide isomerase/thioredoxin